MLVYKYHLRCLSLYIAYTIKHLWSDQWFVCQVGNDCQIWYIKAIPQEGSKDDLVAKRLWSFHVKPLCDKIDCKEVLAVAKGSDSDNTSTNFSRWPVAEWLPTSFQAVGNLSAIVTMPSRNRRHRRDLLKVPSSSKLKVCLHIINIRPWRNHSS